MLFFENSVYNFGPGAAAACNTASSFQHWKLVYSGPFTLFVCANLGRKKYVPRPDEPSEREGVGRKRVHSQDARYIKAVDSS